MFKPVLSVLFFVAVSVVWVDAQCPPGGPTAPPPPPAFSATQGGDYGQLRVTGSNTDPCSTTTYYFVLSDGANSYIATSSGTEQFNWVHGGLSSNWTYYYRAQSGNSLGSSAVVTVSAVTRDLPNPLLAVWSGPGSNNATVWSRYLGDENYGVTVHVRWITPFGLEQNLANFFRDDIGPKIVGFNPWPGLHTYYSISDLINPLEVRRSSNKYLYVAPDQEYGDPNCNRGEGAPKGEGEPVNVINGNMYLDETDYILPGIGEAIDITRSYNSLSNSSGLFGNGWTTQYDESISELSGFVLRLQMPDGQAAYFARSNTSSAFQSATHNVQAQVVKNTDGTFQLTFKEGRIHKFRTDGRLLWLKDRNGNQTSLNYNANGGLQSISDAFGRNVTITLNAIGNISQISDQLSTIATYAYVPGTSYLQTVTYNDGSQFKFEHVISNGRTVIATVKDALNNVLETHQYDSTGRAITSSIGSGAEFYSFNYSDPYKTVVTDGNSNVTNYFHSSGAGRNVVTRIDGSCSCGGGTQSTQYAYDLNLDLIKKTDALGRETNYTYDSERNVTAIQDVLGTQTFTYNSFGQILTATDRMSGVTTNVYDANGNLLTTKDALNNTTTLTYTSLGQPATIKDARNNTTTLTWDTQGRMTKIKDANNKETNFAYDARARVTSVTNALGQATNVEYDLNNRLKKIIYPDTNFVTYTYDLAGRRTGVTDPLNHAMTYAYDAAYRLTGMTDALNHTMTYGYDLMSNLTSQTDALGNVTNLEYDSFNRLKKVKYPLPVSGGTRLEENYTYDLVGNVKTRVDTAGRTTNYDYDNSNRLIKITDALTQLTQFEYNARSQMTKVKDALNQEYVFTYDALGRELSQTRAGSTMTFEYDAVGNRTKRTDYTGRETTYEYDALNRLKKINYLLGSGNQTPNQSATYNYDDLSRLVSAINEAGTVNFTYDNRGRLKTETDVFGHVTERVYDAASRRTQLKLDGANYAAYAYDIADRLTGITNLADSTTIGFGYDNANRMISRNYPNGVTTTYDYDGMSRLTRLKDLSASATLFDRQYSYNSANQISQIVEPSLTRIFGYDNIDRLTSVTGGVTESYLFDSVGNRTSSHLSSSYSYSPFNKLTLTQTTSYNFDANGNTVQKSEGSNFWRYIWDYENRMAEASGRKQKVRYKYDALGRRVSRNLGYGKELTKFTYDGEDVLADDNFGTLTKYVNGPGIDNKLRTQTGSNISYFLADHLGSTNGLANLTGNLIASNFYDSFGNSSNSTFPNRYQFTGRELDSFTGLQFSRARWYDPNLGRFISTDPIGFGGGDINLYGYVRNQPLWFRDPMGLNPGADVLAQPSVLGPLASGAAAAAAAAGATAGAIAVGGAAAIYGASLLGNHAANHPNNPLVNGRWNPFGTPFPILPPWTPTTVSGPKCEVRPRPIPWTSSPIDRPPFFPLPYPPQTPERHEECMDRCIHLLPSPSGDLQSSEFRKCYDSCMGKL